ncbi:MAG: signal peptide peptidase SppA [Candidatus Marinimicrobia bacterium]|nr:signal peptide peptidase SppA [Candidatus Neomarinimicrobiota bacterium]MCH8836566.1 signal peptide peptidase SppA [Candidatus Neomarinimicrobiota bacterium]
MSGSRYDRSMRWMLWLTGIFLLVLVISMFSRRRSGPLIIGKGPRIGIVEVKGLLLDSEKVVRQLERFNRRKDIDAILVRVDSPGGTVAASQEIYEKLRRIRDDGHKPIIASMGTVAASGGLMVALGADTIMANSGTVTGSIGVILDYPVAEDLLSKIGVTVEVIKSGALKDAGSPYRASTAEDRRSFQIVIDDLHEQFTELVARERGLPLEAVRKMATGQVFTGRQALELELIDLLGGYEDALNLAGVLTGNLERPVPVKALERERFSLRKLLLGDYATWNETMLVLPQYRMR